MKSEIQKPPCQENAPPKVSVLILTYKHEKFIAQAIESALMQRAAFDYEVVVADDCSPDRTGQIIERCQAEHPGRIRLSRTTKNSGMYHNFLQAFALCRGEYVALLEGDDFWTFPRKLQTQVAYLDAHPGYALCFHAVNCVRGDGVGRLGAFPHIAKGMLSVEDLLRENLIPTCSVVFRRAALPVLPAWCADVKMLDWPLFVLLCAEGGAGFISRKMASYRIHRDGLWTGKPPSARSEAIIEVLHSVDCHFAHRYAPIIRKRLARAWSHIAWCHEEREQFDEAMRANWSAVAADPFGRFEHKFNWMRLLIRGRWQRLFSATQPRRSKSAPSLSR